MKSGLFIKISYGCLPCLLIVIAGCEINKASVNKPPLREKKDKSFQEPIQYALGKLKDYDLVMIGERHWTHEEPVFIQNLIKRCIEENAIDAVFLEFGRFEDQSKIDEFLNSPDYQPDLVISALRNGTILGWGYQEYFDIFKIVYEENAKRVPSERIKIILVDPSFDDINLQAYFYKSLKASNLTEKEKLEVTGDLRDAILDRDARMTAVSAAYLNNLDISKAIFYCGSKHVRKDLKEKNYGRRYYAAGGLLSRYYPGKVCCLTFHQRPKYWQNTDDYQCIDKLFRKRGKSFAIDTNEPRIKNLMLKSNVHDRGVTLEEVFDGYIMLNLHDDYTPCNFIPGFYNDEFARVVWDRLRQDKERFEKLPPEMRKTPTGEQLMEWIKAGLH